jgi:hypothetical protein
MVMKKTLPIIFGILLIAVFGVVWMLSKNEAPKPLVTNFEECVSAGNAVMESYPRQCNAGGQTFTEFIGNELEKTDLIRIDTPRPNEAISSPLTITGEARGNWYFEASFPVVLTDWDGKIIAQGTATAKGDWMTTDFVPYEATLTFTVDTNAYSNKGSLVLRKDNPSALPANDDALEIPIVFSEVTGGANPPLVACTMEAKLCPDGSAVGRTGPNCEFAECPAVNSLLSESDARIIAEKSCIKGGESLAPGSYNENSQTWWYDANLNATKPGCSPACVVSEVTKTAEINWRCTGLILDSGVTGQVTLGPTCPVMQNPPDPQCADRPYETTIQVIQVGSPQSAPFTTVKTDSQGEYSVTLPPGDYALQPVGGNMLPRCETKNVTVVSSKMTQVNLSCDTGIR